MKANVPGYLGWVVLCRGPGPAPCPQTPWNKCVQNQLGFLIILFDILLDVDFSRTVMLRSEFSSNINRIRAFDGMDPSHVRLMCSGRPRLRSRSVQGLFWHILFTCGGFIFSVLVSEGAPNLRASRRVLAQLLALLYRRDFVRSAGPGPSTRAAHIWRSQFHYPKRT